MEISNPPEKLLEEIEFGITIFRNLKIQEGSYVVFEVGTYRQEISYEFVVTALIAYIAEYYNFRIEFYDPKLFRGFLRRVFLAAYNNSARHNNGGQKEKKIIAGLWAGKIGIIFGICDEGAFFLDKRVKEAFESRTYPRPEKKKIGDAGLDWIFDEHVKKIYVDTKTGVLYLVIMADSIIFD